MKNLYTETKYRHLQREDHVKKEAEVGVMLPQAKEFQQLPEAGRAKERFLTTVLGRSVAQLTPRFWTSGLKNCAKIHFCCFKHSVCGT